MTSLPVEQPPKATALKVEQPPASSTQLRVEQPPAPAVAGDSTFPAGGLPASAAVGAPAPAAPLADPQATAADLAFVEEARRRGVDLSGIVNEPSQASMNRAGVARALLAEDERRAAAGEPAALAQGSAGFLPEMGREAVQGVRELPGAVGRGVLRGASNIGTVIEKATGNYDPERAARREAQVNELIAPPTSMTGEFAEGLVKETTEAAPAVGVLAPLRIPGRIGQATTQAAAKMGAGRAAPVIGGAAAMATTAGEFGAAAQVPEAVQQDSIAPVLEGAAHPFTAAASIAGKVAAGQWDEITVDEWVNAAFIGYGAAKGIKVGKAAAKEVAAGEAVTGISPEVASMLDAASPERLASLLKRAERSNRPGAQALADAIRQRMGQPAAPKPTAPVQTQAPRQLTAEAHTPRPAPEGPVAPPAPIRPAEGQQTGLPPNLRPQPQQLPVQEPPRAQTPPPPVPVQPGPTQTPARPAETAVAGGGQEQAGKKPVKGQRYNASENARFLQNAASQPEYDVVEAARMAYEARNPNVELSIHPEDLEPLQIPRVRQAGISVSPDSEARAILGDRQYERLIQAALGGRKARVETLVDQIMSEPGSFDPELVIRAYLHRQYGELSPEQRKAGFEIVNPKELPPGTTIKIANEEFTVTRNEEGEVMLEDGVTLYAPDRVPVDKGSVEKPSPKPTGALTGQQKGLLGEQFDGGITGSQQSMFETQRETSASKREEESFREQQTPKDKETAEMFPPPTKIERAKDEPSPKGAFSARRVDVDRDRAELGRSVIPSPQTRAWDDVLEQAATKIDADEADAIAARIINRPEPMTDVETAGLVIRRVEIGNRYDQVVEKVVAKREKGEQTFDEERELMDLEAKFDAVTKAMRLSGTEKGRALAAQRLTINKNYDLVSVKNRFEAKKGSKATEAETQQLKELTDRLKAAENKIDAMQGEISELQASKTMKREARTERKTSRKSLVDKIRELAQKGCHK